MLCYTRIIQIFSYQSCFFFLSMLNIIRFRFYLITILINNRTVCMFFESIVVYNSIRYFNCSKVFSRFLFIRIRCLSPMPKFNAWIYLLVQGNRKYKLKLDTNVFQNKSHSCFNNFCLMTLPF